MTLKNYSVVFGFVAVVLSSIVHAASPAENFFQEALLVETGERDLEKAVRLYEDVLKRAKNNDLLISKCYLRLGACYERLGRPGDAMSAYENVLVLSASSTGEIVRLAQENLARLRGQSEEVRWRQKRGTFIAGQPIHRIKLFGVGYGSSTDFYIAGGRANGYSPYEKQERHFAYNFALELLGYEFIHPSGLALEVTPLSIHTVYTSQYGGDLSRHYTPLWAKYYFRKPVRGVAPFLGVGLDITRFPDRSWTILGSYYNYATGQVDTRWYQKAESQTRAQAAAQVGIDWGGGLFRRNQLTLKLLPEQNDFLKNQSFFLLYSFCLGFQNRES